MKRISGLFFLLLLTLQSFSQSNSVSLKFIPTFSGEEIQTESKFYHTNESGSVFLETFRFYISGIELLNDGKSTWKRKNSYHLIDVSSGNSLSIALNLSKKIKYNQVRFHIGIDSITQVSGARGGDLDPTKGMYWTWQSGYINFKLEGKCSDCISRNNEFQFHIGGYQSPFNSLQTVTLPFSASQTEIIVDVYSLLSEINLSKQDHIMSPGEEAMRFAKLLPSLFKPANQ